MSSSQCVREGMTGKVMKICAEIVYFACLSMFDRLIARPTDTASFIDALGRKIVVGPQMSVFMTSSRYDTMIT